MTRLLLALATAALLAACGVDGPPSPPPPREDPPQRAPGVSVAISGNVGVGVAGGSTSFRRSR